MRGSVGSQPQTRQQASPTTRMRTSWELDNEPTVSTLQPSPLEYHDTRTQEHAPDNQTLGSCVATLTHMRKLYVAATAWLAIGLIAGVFYREFTRAHHFDGETQLSVVHTHALILGMTMNLLFLIFVLILRIDNHPRFTAFFWIYNLGAAWTVSFLAIHGIYNVLGKDFPTTLAMCAGMGHIIITVGFTLFFAILNKHVKRWQRQHTDTSQ